MKIVIETVEHKDQRYPTIGDWQWNSTTQDPYLVIRVSDLKDEKMNSCIIIHELVEALLCKFNDPEITTEQVDQFDISHPELIEPGESDLSPYLLQHKIALSIERIIASNLKINWEDYCKKIDSLMSIYAK